MDAAALRSLVQTQADTIVALQRQIEWFRRQMFGQKSERVVAESPTGQLPLEGTDDQEPVSSTVVAAPTPKTIIPAHARRAAKRGPDVGDELPFFDETRVPIQTIILVPEEIKGLAASEYEITSEKVSYRAAQRPGSYQVIKYIRRTVKLKATGAIETVPAPEGILNGSRADVSLAAGLLIDKFVWHLPLYRQHQRMEASGVNVSRPWLTQISQQTIALLEPIYDAQFASIRQSRVKAMDETPIKAGKSGHGKMQTGYFWPVYGEEDEVCFPFHASRSADFVSRALGLNPGEGSVLITDGYAAYERYAKLSGVTQAQCWAHARRMIFEAESASPEAVQDLLVQIQRIYAVEEEIRERNLTGEAKQMHRLMHSKPLVERFFAWIDRRLARHGLKPKDPFISAISYARERRDGLQVFLTDPDVPMDTNHIERALRVIPMGRKNWLFCWTELGARQVGIVQSLLVTCKLHGIDPYTYLVDVLQRVSEHPAAKVAELTPRQWKSRFADRPMRSDIDQFPV